ncbi:LysR family transcriptional regulator [Massilia sp. DJPM01]|uniref:LysR family transcriptional regulator n=1 Tax=Massilia sp. DJPM01 TaxID=3024404 RepID=UPI00259E5018|nr:LysR family transcriptional regulator [Massilia sp. DJPM01]MDM5179970.1 LysR family transcriptional regulator [Massilia sp. DJPM01]
MTPLDQIDLNSLTIFDAVAEAGSFTAAADRLGVAKARISVQIARLERQLGVSLFTRTTRQVAPTDAGRALHAQCQPLLRALSDALAQAGSDQGELSGMLRISTTALQVAHAIGPALVQFMALHPRLTVDLRTADKVVDMIAEGIDLSFRMGWLRDSTQRAIKLGEFSQHVVAAPSYLRQRGYPATPQDLVRHDWVALSLMRTPHTWTFTGADGAETVVQTNSRMQVDSPAALLALIEQGAGISVLEGQTLAAGLKAGAVVELLPQWSLPRGGMYAVLPPGRQAPARVRAFIDFYRDYLLRAATP